MAIGQISHQWLSLLMAAKALVSLSTLQATQVNCWFINDRVTAVTFVISVSRSLLAIEGKLMTDTYTHSFDGSSGFRPGLPTSSGTRKVQPGRSNKSRFTGATNSYWHWATCKSAPHPRHITMPISHHSVFCRPHVLPAAQPIQSTEGIEGKLMNKL